MRGAIEAKEASGIVCLADLSWTEPIKKRPSKFYTMKRPFPTPKKDWK